MTRKPPNLVEFAVIAAGLGGLFGGQLGAALGLWLGENLTPPGVTGPQQPAVWIGGGAVAGSALGLLVAFLRRPRAGRESEE